MQRTLLAGWGNPALAAAVAERVGGALGQVRQQRFLDGELQVEILQTVRDHDLYVIQPTSPPVAENLLELMLIVDAARRAGAKRITAVIPYFGYARQDRRVVGREAVGARLVADLLQASGVDRIVAVDLHSASLEGFFGVPIEHLSAVPLLAEALRPLTRPDGIIVSPDLGAVRLAEQYGRILGLPVAIVHKTRLSGEEVRAEQVVGDVQGRSPIVVDDMISTGGTVESAVRAVLAAGSVENVIVAATHPLLVGPCAVRLSALPIQRLVVSDSVAPRSDLIVPVQVVSLAPLIAGAIDHLSGHAAAQD